MLILGIESSCDETAAAVLADGEQLLADVINTQVAVHAKYGGVVPELASRMHLEAIYPVVEEALNQAGVSLDDIDGIAVTQGPGLIGSLLVGLSFAKAVSFVRQIPYVGVDHMNGHLLSVFLDQHRPSFPYIAVVASGGHSSIFRVNSPQEYLLLGRTRDDAAGEAFDKVGKLLGLAYPGGPVIGKLAEEGNEKAIPFPRAWLDPESLDFSFSGLKTAVVNFVNRHQQKGQGELPVADICASFQEAVVDVLVEKGIRAAKRENINQIVIAGGVASNNRFREEISRRGKENNVKVYMPRPRFCTDNGAMIALAGYHRFLAGDGGYDYEMDVYSRVAILKS
ncbi:MAG: tRNA (adenosine(37)-N6)-threonylcarbamoyltransferase complex transferase subunit TsaD [Desulfobulbaceae bacterium]|nr:tRNA (adenosine(37)-N6)-threonylcarbamoyltransferase complex transferase subunit TsaD [Desulfobulbaceae bacterium]